MSDPQESLGIHEITIDGWKFRVVGDVVNASNLSTYQRKTVIGDYTRDSNPVYSTFIITDLSAGHGVEELEEGTDTARYRFGVIESRRPRQITIPYLTTVIASPNDGDCCPMVMYKSDFYIAFGSDLYTANSDALGVTDTGFTLTAPPVSRRVAIHRNKLYIPHGSGFDVFDGSAVTPSTDFEARAFVRWDRRLYGIDTDGQIWVTQDGITWENEGDDALIDDGSTIRSMFSFYDRSDFPMPVVVTNRGLWSFETSGPTLYPTEVEWPIDVDMGLGSEKWRNELYLGVKMGVFRYNGETQSAMGLDRDQGLPEQIRGKIVDLFGEFNGLFALVSGEDFTSEFEETMEFDTTDDELYLPESSAVSSLHVFTGYGWYCIWTSEDAGGLPTWMGLQSEQGIYALWWGTGATINTMRFPIDFANARAVITSETGWFAKSGYFETGLFDAGLTSYTKIGDSILIRCNRLTAGCEIKVDYRLSADDAYTPLGTITDTDLSTDGEATLSFGPGGKAFKAIEFRVTLIRPDDNERTAPIISSLVFSYQKILPNYRSYTVKIDMQSQYNEKSPTEMREKLESLLTEPRFYVVNYGKGDIRSRLAQANGGQIVGKGDDKSDMTVSIIEMPGRL